MKFSGGMHLEFICKWYKNHFFPVILNGRKVDCPEMHLSGNAPLSPTARANEDDTKIDLLRNTTPFLAAYGTLTGDNMAIVTILRLAERVFDA